MITRFRSIRQKFIFLYLMFFLLGLVGIAGNYGMSIRPLLTELESRFVDTRIRRLASTFHQELTGMERTTFDWASWNAMYDYVVDRNTTFADDNFIPESLTNLRMDVLIVYNREGQIINSVYSQTAEASGLEDFAKRRLSESLLKLPSLLNQLLEPRKDRPGVSGFLNTPAGILFLAMQPISRSDLGGPSHGALLFGRLLTPEYKSILEEQASASFQLQPLRRMASRLQAYSLDIVRLGQFTPQQFPLSDTRMRVELGLQDINQDGTILLQSLMDRELYGLGRGTLDFSVYFAFSLFAIIFGMFIFSIHILIIRPLQKLQDYIARVRSQSCFVAEPPLAHDEIGLLARSFTGLLDELILKQQELSRLSNEDGLTKVANRRRFDELFAQAFSEAQQQNCELGLIMIDIDYFKRYNDHYGHLKGDEVLRDVADGIRQCCNEHTDLVARYGGEEFVIFLQGCGVEPAYQLAEAIRAKIADMGIPHIASGCGLVVTLSCGVTGGVPAPHAEPVNWLIEADEALYAAKANGRNRIECYWPFQVSPKED